LLNNKYFLLLLLTRHLSNQMIALLVEYDDTYGAV
jgi:hypothetical protein